MAISPDGSEMYYTLQSNQHAFSTILVRKRAANGDWGSPEVASFSGVYKDLEPAFAPDGKKLYFSSARPAEGKTGDDYDIWVVELQGKTWGTPGRLGPEVNTKENEYYPSVARNGNIYFTAAYESGIGKEDIFLSRWNGHGYEPSEALDSAVNSSTWEFNAFVSPDESFILFTSYGRPDDLGGGDLYISFRSTGKWQPAIHLAELNSSKLDYCPFVTADQSTLYFTSQRHTISDVRDAKASYQELMNAYNGTANGSDDIYRVDFTLLKKELTKE
jgi:Tol biopolymer transport system component